MASRVRPPTHSDARFGFGEWYDADPSKLEATVRKCMQTTANRSRFIPASQTFDPSRFLGVISPHAGLRFSGPAAGVAYNLMMSTCVPAVADTAAVARYRALKRIIVMGPSHKEHFEGVAVSGFEAYDTPLARLSVDQEANKLLAAALTQPCEETNAKTSILPSWLKGGAGAVACVPFHVAKQATEESEHSLEMQLPFIAYILRQRQERFPDAPRVKILPLIVGDVTEAQEATLGNAIQRTFFPASGSTDSPRETLLCVSSDFCHWGSRFRYTYEFNPRRSSAATRFAVDGANSGTPIPPEAAGVPRFAESALCLGHKIELMDHEAMAAVEAGDASAWDAHLRVTENTICGRHPIGVALRGLLARGSAAVSWLHYDQSSLCQRKDDSSVSYAAGVILSA
jgi:AmmeMemoRadiSam system protein B